jgi:hypothetical protein
VIPNAKPQHILRVVLALRDAAAPMSAADIARTQYWTPYGSRAAALIQTALLDLYRAGDLIRDPPGHYRIAPASLRRFEDATADTRRAHR